MLDQSKEFSAFDTQKDLFSLVGGKRIFLSGGTGFFGKWLLESFLYFNKAFKLDAAITVLSRDPQSFLLQWPDLKSLPELTFIQGDVLDFKFPTGKYDFIIHAATEDDSRRMLEFAVRAKASRFMLTSSGAVYGPQPFDMAHMPETCICSPSTVYGRAKLMAEETCVDAGNQYGITVLLPRCFAFVGPYLDLDIHFAIGNFIRDCLQDRPIIIKGDGTPLRSYLYAADMAQWLWTILLKGTHARAYNVGSPQGITIRELADRVRDCAGGSNPIEILQAAIPGARVARYVPCIDRVSSELNLKPRYLLDEAITRTLDWYRKEV